MCGIAGYVGNKEALSILINGLSKLEYRGYDSAGISIICDGNIKTVKKKGRISVLEEFVKNDKINGHIGIGHTRWATHGEPSDKNSHPHTNTDGSISIVHNGIIENYIKLRDDLISKGYKFLSDTDTEVVVHLLDYYYKKDKNIKDAVFSTLNQIEGTYALGIICKDYPDTLIAARKGSPLIIGVGENENFIASDVPAILNYTKKIYLLDDGEVALINKDSILIYDKNKNEVKKDIFEVTWDMESAEKGGFEHFMLKEIFDQPKAIKDTLLGRLKNDYINLDEIKIDKKILENINRVYIVACGTAYHAGLMGKKFIESLCGIPVITDVASEFRYNNPIIDNKTLLIVLSQSGETADTLAAVRLAKEKGARILGVVNTVGSSIAREADDLLYTLAGLEIAVASTKAYTSQVVSMYLLANLFALELGKISKNDFENVKLTLEKLPGYIEDILKESDKIEKLSKEYINIKNVFYIGRGLDYFICKEGSLKLKEVSYLYSEAYPAGELKHGPIALLQEDSLVIGIATCENTMEKLVSNLQECKARGSKILSITTENNNIIKKVADNIIYIPYAGEFITPILANIPLQLFAYYMAINLGRDVDKPRNLAKSVTVE